MKFWNKYIGINSIYIFVTHDCTMLIYGLFVFDDGLRTLTCAYPPCELFFKPFTAGINEAIWYFILCWNKIIKIMKRYMVLIMWVLKIFKSVKSVLYLLWVSKYFTVGIDEDGWYSIYCLNKIIWDVWK